jgi:MoaA/NifB/PqqE/SkfB family radical SAM enzyme
MRSLEIRFKINTTLTRWNEHEIEEMFAIAERLGAPLTVDPDVTPRDDGDLTPLEIGATPEGRRRLFSYGKDAHLAQHGEPEAPPAPTSKHCGAGSSAIAVDPFGNVYPCVQWRRPVGNLHRRSIREIWRGNAGLEEVRRLSEEVKKSLPGGAGMFCPGTAEGLTGSPLPVHPSST